MNKCIKCGMVNMSIDNLELLHMVADHKLDLGEEQ